MSITFNANEIFEMAEEIERNGAKFYRKAAQNTSDNQTKQMLLDMADMIYEDKVKKGIGSRPEASDSPADSNRNVPMEPNGHCRGINNSHSLLFNLKLTACLLLLLNITMGVLFARLLPRPDL